jgi:hypothetical protein
MTTNQENKLKMYFTVITYLNQYETMLNTLPHFAECFTQLKDSAFVGVRKVPVA